MTDNDCNIKVMVYPRDPNPYQGLVYSKIPDSINIQYLDNPTRSNTLGLILLFPQLLYYRIKRSRIFHLHWFYTFYAPFRNRLFTNLITRAFYTLLFLIFLYFIKILGYKLVWTVHNVVPLEKQFLNTIKIMRILSKLCDSKIVHSETTLSSMKRLGMDIEDSHIIPIGNYGVLYPNEIKKDEARKKLGIDSENFVFCFFGIIENYKGVPKLIKDFLSFGRKNIELLIAGECRNPDLKQEIMNYNNYSNIHLQLNFIKDEDIQVYLKAADIAVYPFKSITTSSSVILSLSFGIPIICPRMGNLKDLPENLGIFYDPDDKSGLLKCMEQALKNKEILDEMGFNALKYTKDLSWDNISYRTSEVYKKMLMND